jgi:hypothetical protein
MAVLGQVEQLLDLGQGESQALARLDGAQEVDRVLSSLIRELSRRKAPTLQQ